MTIEGLAMSLTVWCLHVTKFLSSGEAVKERPHVCVSSGLVYLKQARSLFISSELGHSEGICSQGGAGRLPLPHRFAFLPAATLSAVGLTFLR